MHRALSLITLLAAGPAWAAECPATASDLALSLENAERSYSDLDLDGFHDATNDSLALVQCLEEPLTPALAARLHRMRGLRAFVDRDSMTARSFFAAARSIEPGYQFPSTMVPSGNPVRDDYDALDPTKGKMLQAAAAEEGHLTFDGRTTNERPLSFPTVFQRFDGTGAVADTRLLLPGDDLPDYPQRSYTPELETPSDNVAVATPEPQPAPQKKAHPLRVPLWAAGGAALVTSGVMAGLSSSARAKWADPDTPFNELDGYRDQTNTFALASGAAAGVAVGLGVTGVFVAKF